MAAKHSIKVKAVAFFGSIMNLQFLRLALTGWLACCGAAQGAEVNRLEPVPLSADVQSQCYDVLRQGLKSNQFWPSMHAAEALSLAGQGPSVREALAGKLATETDPQHRCGLARELVRAGDRTRLSLLFATLADAQSNGRIHAAESLYKLGEVGDGRLLRSALQQSDDARLQLMAAAALGRCGNQAALERVRQQLSAADRATRQVAAWILGLLGEPRDCRPLWEMHGREDDPLVRAYAVHALACLGDDLARVELGKNLSSPDAALRTYSAEFAGYSRSVEFHGRLIKLLADRELDVRVRAAQSLLALSKEASWLKLPLAAASEPFSVDVFRATPDNPRYSEGSLLALRDGSLLYATTEFIGGCADHAAARIVARDSHDGGRSWELPRVLQPNVGRQNVMSVTLRRLPPGHDESPLGMFYLVKNSPSDLKAYLRVSSDDARTFGEPILVTDAPGYHVLNNDRITQLSSGRLICPVAWTADVSKQGHFVAQCFLSDDRGRTWLRAADEVDQPGRGAMEPEVVQLDSGRLMMIVRTQLGFIATSISSDGGDHWSATSRLPLAAPEAPATLRRIPATGDLVLIWNNNYEKSASHGGKRTPLTSAVSPDEGQTWSHLRNIEHRADQTFAYTSLLFHQDRVLLGYYVRDEKSGRISSRFRSFPVRWLYDSPSNEN